MLLLPRQKIRAATNNTHRVESLAGKLGSDILGSKGFRKHPHILRKICWQRNNSSDTMKNHGNSVTKRKMIILQKPNFKSQNSAI